MAMAPQPSLLDTAERVAGLLAEQGIGAVVIGAAALAAHRYVRHTEDIDGGLADATLPMLAGGSLRIIPLANLVALKLCAGVMKSKADIVELLRRNPAADRSPAVQPRGLALAMGPPPGDTSFHARSTSI